MRRPTPRLLAASALLACAAVLLPAGAGADTRDEDALAQKHAPVVRLVQQTEPCGPGEPYEPLDVDALFDEPTVALRGPWGPNDIVKIAPSADDLGRGAYEHHLDFPGDALDPGCSYEQWARRITQGDEPTVYAHVATDPAHPGKLALQYWLFYAFNDWNNLHEGDWEMIQLVFDADDAREALGRDPVEVGYSQHEGAERADWGEDKLEIVDGAHPVVHPAAGSHANFYGEALFLGSSASQGVGCDNTNGPTYDLHPRVRTIPGDLAEGRAAYPWTGFEGRWGELQPAFYNGPTGPNLKLQWAEPIAWTDEWRERAYAVPAGGLLGTSATDSFCSVIASGSRALGHLIAQPTLGIAVLVALIALIVFGISRATWTPVAPLRVARRRSWGQILAASARVYARRPALFIGIGVLLVPISVLVAIMQALVLHASGVLGIPHEGEGGGVLVLFVIALGTALTLFGVALVQAAIARALAELDAGRTVGPVQAYRLAAGSIHSLLPAILLAVLIVTLLFLSVFLIPVGIWLAVRWSLIAPVIALEDRSAIGAIHRSARLVRHAWLKVGSLTIASIAIALAAGPLVGAILILVTDAPLAWLNIVAGVIYALMIPFAALATAYVYADTFVADALAPPAAPGSLPAETELPGLA